MRLPRRLFGTSVTVSRPEARSIANTGTPDHALRPAAADRDRRSDAVAGATALNASGHHGQALTLLVAALAETPSDPELLFARASTLFAWGRSREAADAFSQLVSRGLYHEGLSLQLGWSHFNMRNLAEAEVWMRKAVAELPTGIEAQWGLAAVLAEQERFDEAIASCRQVLKAKPDDPDGLVMLGDCLLRKGQPAVGEEFLRRAVVLDRDRAAAWTSLGVALRLQYRHSEALEAFERAVKFEAPSPEAAESFVNLALQYQIMGRTRDAIELFERCLAQRPNFAGHRAYAHALLSVGRLLEGWQQYEFRWFFEPLRSLRVGPLRPMWGGQDLRGKTVMLRIEQGFGDTIQFLRYAPRLKALGATVLLRKFSELAYGFPGVDRVLEDDKIPEFDYYIHLLSLPRVFETDLTSIPDEIPYVTADADRVARWATRMPGGGALRVGLAWAGNPAHPRDRERSMPLRALAPVIELDAAWFFALQKGTPAAEAEAYADNPRFVNLGPEFEDFADSAAVITQLDLLICVDTAVAHLAGALGKSVWLMVQKDADWRWLEGREDTPWYPSMRLFRQPLDGRPGDWSDVVARVRGALQELVAATAANKAQPEAAKTEQRPIELAVNDRLPYSTDRKGVPVKPGLSAVAETRVGILQYLPDEPIVGDSVGWYGELLQQQLNLLAGLVRPGDTVLESAAGVGAHSLSLARAIGAKGHLFVFESRPVMRTILRQNLAANKIDNVTLMPRPLGQREPAEPETASVAPDSAGTTAANPQMPILDALDDLQLETLRLLKINDSAQVPNILAGGLETLWRLRPFVFVSARDERVVDELGDKVKAFGYRCWRLSTPLFNADNFNRRDTDIFSGKHATALLAIPEEIEVNMATDQCVEL